MTFTPDGTSLVAGLGDGAILIWVVEKMEPKLLLIRSLGKENLESCWSGPMGQNAGKAHQAVGPFVAGAIESVPFLRSRLKPVPVADPGKIMEWIDNLNSEKFIVRQAATKELEKVDVQAIRLIQTAIQGSTSLEARRRLEQILNAISDVPGPETVRTIRAIMALERIGFPDAQTVLRTLAGGAPGARETEEAKASLERLAQRASRMP